MKEPRYIPILEDTRAEKSIVEFSPEDTDCVITWQGKIVGYTVKSMIVFFEPVYDPVVLKVFTKSKMVIFHSWNRAWNELMRYLYHAFLQDKLKLEKGKWKLDDKFLREYINVIAQGWYNENLDKEVEELYQKTLMFLAGTERNLEFMKLLDKEEIK